MGLPFEVAAIATPKTWIPHGRQVIGNNKPFHWQQMALSSIIAILEIARVAVLTLRHAVFWHVGFFLDHHHPDLLIASSSFEKSWEQSISQNSNGGSAGSSQK